jgi:uncharacterized protein (TIGR02391 family)
MAEFFRDDAEIDIYNQKYKYSSGSKANYMCGFWLEADDKTVGKSILKLLEYIETQILLGNLDSQSFPEKIKYPAKAIAERLLGTPLTNENESRIAFKDCDNINIELQKEIFDHIKKLLNDKHYYNAVEEAYKIVREKLREITGEEKATDACKNSNFEKIFGHKPRNDAEKDFFEGVKFLHMAIQFLRNEKSHTPAHDLDKNLAIHHISLASLAYDLITRK